MEEKICSKCKLIKPYSDFTLSKTVKSGRKSSCKDCDHKYYLENKQKFIDRQEKNKDKIKIYAKDRYENNKEELLRKKNKYRANNKEKIQAQGKIYRENNKEEIERKRKIYYDKTKVLHPRKNKTKEELRDNSRKCAREYYHANKEKIKEYRESTKNNINAGRRRWSSENRDKVKKYNKDNYSKNRDQKIEYANNYRFNNRDKINISRKENNYKQTIYQRERMKSDPVFKLSRVLRSRILSSIKAQNGTKAYGAIELLGCTIKEARDHLEKKFTKGMSWDNHSKTGWHIDHIIPCCSFDLTDPIQQKKCFNYTNLQPLWAFDNLSKGCKISSKNKLD